MVASFCSIKPKGNKDFVLRVEKELDRKVRVSFLLWLSQITRAVQKHTVQVDVFS